MIKVVIGIILAALLALIGASSSHAASAWDDIIKTTETLQTKCISYNSSPDFEDHTLDWAEILLKTEAQGAYTYNDNWTLMTQIQNQFTTNLGTGSGWAVAQSSFNGTEPDEIAVYIWEPTEVTPIFTTIGGNEVLKFDGAITSGEDRNIWSVQLEDLQQSWGIQCGDWNLNTSGKPGFTSSGGNLYTDGSNSSFKWLFIADDIEYPDGYEGIEVPDVAPAAPRDEVPAWRANVLNFEGEFFDQNFFTFDNVPFLCDQELAPVIDWEFYSIDDEIEILIDSGTNSSTAVLTYTFSQGDYKLYGKYRCDDDINTFSQYGTYLFTINEYGSVDQSQFSDCITSEFPWVDINGCISNVFTLINLLSFGVIELPEFETPDGCHTLGTIGDWLMLSNENRYICPQFSSEVRNITTPFVTFLAGLIILAAITIKSKREVV